MKKGKLVRIRIGRSQFKKMYEADAIAQGLLPSKTKPSAHNKMRLSTGNKLAPQKLKVENAPLEDDFTTIHGVGPATVRALIANGITTFEQLRQCEALDYITSKSMKAIEAWKNS